MAWLFVVPMLGFLIFLVVGAISGRVKVNSCCSVADPRRDSRMRSAFADEDADLDREPKHTSP